jgi:hypothetical protein
LLSSTPNLYLLPYLFNLLCFTKSSRNNSLNLSPNQGILFFIFLFFFNVAAFIDFFSLFCYFSYAWSDLTTTQGMLHIYFLSLSLILLLCLLYFVYVKLVLFLLNLLFYG